MTEGDWQHALRGTHFLLELDTEIVAYASVAERQLEVGSRQLRTGYVEAVATAVPHQRRGLGSLLMTAVQCLHPRGVRARGTWHRTPPLLRTARLDHLEGAYAGPDAGRSTSYSRRGRIRSGDVHTGFAGARPCRVDQLRLAFRDAW